MPYIFGPMFTDLGSLLITLVWIVMLVDAATNQSIRGSRVLWMLFIFFTHILGDHLLLLRQSLSAQQTL